MEMTISARCSEWNVDNIRRNAYVNGMRQGNELRPLMELGAQDPMTTHEETHFQVVPNTANLGFVRLPAAPVRGQASQHVSSELGTPP